MSALLESAIGSLRRARAPLTSGALVIFAAWIQIADLVSDDWPGRRFAEQVGALFQSLQTVGLGMILLLIIGVAGNLITRTARLLIDPIMRWFVESWKERRDVRTHMQRTRVGPFDVGGSEAEIAELLEAERRQYVRNTLRWLRDWFPDEKAYVAYTTRNLWLTPKWDRKIVGWVASEVHQQLNLNKRSETPASMRRRLRKNSSLQSAMLSLERELEQNPSAPFMGEDYALVSKIDELRSENEYRLAVMPALTILLISIGIGWWYWALLFVPLPILAYGSSLAKQDDVSVLALGLLLDGKGSSHSLEELRHWAANEAARINKS